MQFIKLNKEIEKIFSLSQKNDLFWLLTSIILLTCFEVLSVGLIIPLIIILVSPEFFINFSLTKDLINYFQIEENNLIFVILILLIIIFSLKTFFQYKIVLYQAEINSKLINNLRYKVLNSYLSKNYYFFLKKSFSDIKSFLNVSCQEFIFFYIGGIINLISEIIVILGMLLLLLVASIFFFDLNFSFFLIIFLMIFLVFLYFKLLKKKQKNIGKFFNDIKYKIFKINNHAISFIRENKIFNSSKYFLDNLQKQNKLLLESAVFIHAASHFPRLFLEFFFVLGSISIVFFLIFSEFSSLKIISVVSTYGVVSFRMFPSFNKVMVNIQHIKHYKYLKTILFEVLEENKKLNTNKTENLDFLSKINLNGINFSYENNHIFKNFDFEISKGEKLCILGSSGTGKSTLVNIIMGLLKPDKGYITVDNKKILSEEDIILWQKKISLVPQDIVLLNDSILNNIVISDTSKPVDLEKINKLLKGFKLYDFVYSTEKKLDTIISDGLLNMSGGQKQRLALVRAFYKDPELIILDEATSSLDQSTAYEIIENLIEIQQEQTILFVTHDKNIEKYCSKTFHLKNL